MKKTYIKPELEIEEILIAQSILVGSIEIGGEDTDPGEFEVKEQRRDVGNVWDNDWSK